MTEPDETDGGAIARLKKWWRYKFSTRWVDTGDQWWEYETRWQSEYAADIDLKICEGQVHADTGEYRVKRTHYVNIPAPIEKFDARGNFRTKSGATAPSPETEPVENPNREPPEHSIVVDLGGDDNDE